MTPGEISGLRGLVERARRVVRSAQKASTGPWRKFRSNFGNDTIAIMQGDEPAYDERGYHVNRWKELVTWMGFDGAETSETKKHANARAICAAVNFARDDLPALLAAFDAQQARIAESERVIEGLNNQLTEQFELSTKYVALAEERRECIAALTEALRPFAKALDRYHRDDGNQLRLTAHCDLNLGDLRRASALVEGA